TSDMKKLAIGLTQALGLEFLVWFVTGGDWMPGRSILVMDAGIAFLLLVATRLGLRQMREARQAQVRGRRAEASVRRVGIVGANELGAWLARQIAAAGSKRQVVAFFDDNPDKWNLRLCDVPVAGMPECLVSGAWADQLDEVILVIPESTEERRRQIKTLLSKM